MPDFSKGKIYKLVSNKSSDVYIGSCLVDLSKRLYGHKKPSNTCVSKSMFVDDAIISIVLIEDYACENKNQLKARELHYITTLECININKPFITDVNYDDKKEWHKQYQANYNETHKEQKAQYRETNKEQRAEKAKQYNATNKEHIAQYQAQYNETHKEQKAQYRETNKEQILQQQAQYYQLHKEQKAQYYETNKEQKAQYQAQYNETHKEHIAQVKKQYYQLQKLKQSS